jgi:hypothetical protein
VPPGNEVSLSLRKTPRTLAARIALTNAVGLKLLAGFTVNGVKRDAGSKKAGHDQAGEKAEGSAIGKMDQSRFVRLADDTIEDAHCQE